LVESKQEQKYMLSLAGEFLVAGELLRRNMTAAVTYGNAKRADVLAVSGRSAVPIEVKTTREPKWVIGSKVPEADNSIWVLVYLPQNDTEPPEFFVLRGDELHTILKPKVLEWEKLNRDKEFWSEPRAVWSVLRQQVKACKGAWNKIEAALAGDMPMPRKAGTLSLPPDLR
jgi:hypothetical protein